MFPIAEDKLSLIGISNYWAREIQPPATQLELFYLLEQAWWLGEIRGDSALSRLQLLQRVFQAMRDRRDVEIIFVQGENPTAPAEVTALEDGGVLVNLRPRIPVPVGDPSDWAERACEPAFQALVQTSSIKSYSDFATFFTTTELTHKEFNDWCEKRGFAKPAFWRSSAKSSPLQKSMGAGAIEEVDSGTEPHSGADKAHRPSRKMPPEPEKPGPRKQAWKALKARFPDGQIPEDFSRSKLQTIVNQHLRDQPRGALEGRIREEISLDTVLRAVGRKK